MAKMLSEKPLCKLCGEPMPEGEEMFNYHGYSGPCPKPPLPNIPKDTIRDKIAEVIWRNQPAQEGGLEHAMSVADKILEAFTVKEIKS
jgi:hypothetical protein